MGIYNEFCALASMSKIVCFGAGKKAAEMLQDTSMSDYIDEIAFFVDNSADKQGATIDGGNRAFKIYSPERIRDIPNCLVLITVWEYESIARQVQEICGARANVFVWRQIKANYELESVFCDDNEYTRLVLMNTPDYRNIGDHAIAMAERLFLKNYFGNPILELGSRICQEAINYFPDYIKKDDVLFITGGGYMGTLWPGNEMVIRETISLFPDNNIIIFPQSVYYGDSCDDRHDLERSRRIYNNHKKRLLICARDMNSFAFFKENYPCCSHLLLPDMVLMMRNMRSEPLSGIGINLRDDKETFISEQSRNAIINAAKSSGEGLHFFSNHVPETDSICHSSGEAFVQEKLKEYGGYRCVITDRLHGMVFSAISAAPCIVFDNSYHKNSALYQSWLSNLQHIKFVDEISETHISALIAEMLEIEPGDCAEPDFQEEYKPLADYIAALEGVRKCGGYD